MPRGSEQVYVLGEPDVVRMLDELIREHQPLMRTRPDAVRFALRAFHAQRQQQRPQPSVLVGPF